MTSIRVAHPVNDFLTPDIINFLQELEQGTIKQTLTILYGCGGNGKSIFVELLKNLKSFEYFSIHEEICSKYIKYIKNTINKQSKKPDIILLPCDMYSEKAIMGRLACPKIAHELKTIGIPIIMMVNFDPTMIFTSTPEVKILYFNNLYHTDIDEPVIIDYAKVFNLTLKKNLDKNQIVNEEGIQIIKNTMISKKRRRSVRIQAI
jgi:hypothetical protein